MTSPTLCSADWDDSDLPVWGSAKDASVIVAVESAGSWGRDPVAESGLRAPKGATLYVVRSVGPHSANPQRRAVIVSGGFGDEPWLVMGRLTDVQVERFLTGDVTNPRWWGDFGLVLSDSSIVLVCTNGKRDACCAVRGRPVATAAFEAAPGRVWEVSHIGGHRFAPTTIHLPSGQTFGRLTPDDGAALASAGPDEPLPRLFTRSKHRGRVDLNPAQRVAETVWREEHPDLPMLPPVRLGPSGRVGDDAEAVRLPDGRRVVVMTRPGPPLRDSCIKQAKPSQFHDARIEA